MCAPVRHGQARDGAVPMASGAIPGEGPHMDTKRWSMEIEITEEGNETFARAVLFSRDKEHLIGVGQARRNPADPMVHEIGDELAVARALADLASKLLTAASSDVAKATGSREPVHLSLV
ncbi:hypothetical protein GCM10010106_03380 [Thermopolyspora flexuosa]|nr:hypothetical protein GCM10010106_03380 [Thermopolyspora flexuosa]